MINKLKEIRDNYKNRVVIGDYVILKIDPYYAIVEMDGMTFNLWTANGEKSFKQYAYDDNITILISDMNQYEKKKGFNILFDRIESPRKDMEKKRELELLASLKKKYE